MTRSQVCTGLAIAPWNVLGGGKIRTDAEEERRRQTGEEGRKAFGSWERNETERKVSQALEKVAGEVGAKAITAGTCIPSYLIYVSKYSLVSL